MRKASQADDETPTIGGLSDEEFLDLKREYGPRSDSLGEEREWARMYECRNDSCDRERPSPGVCPGCRASTSDGLEGERESRGLADRSVLGVDAPEEEGSS